MFSHLLAYIMHLYNLLVSLFREFMLRIERIIKESCPKTPKPGIVTDKEKLKCPAPKTVYKEIKGTESSSKLNKCQRDLSAINSNLDAYGVYQAAINEAYNETERDNKRLRQEYRELEHAFSEQMSLKCVK